MDGASVILFVTHEPKQCGVYEFGKNVFDDLVSSTRYRFVKAECNSIDKLENAVDLHRPSFIIYNYHPTVLPWLCTKIAKGVYRNNIAHIRATQIGIIHEVTQHIADTATGYRNRFILGPSQKKLNSLFDAYVAPDPTLLLKNPLVFKTGRLIPEYRNNPEDPARLTVGSFGFATPNKGFEKIVARVQDEFDDAVIRINMPAADFGDPDGSNAARIADNCRKLVTNPGIDIEISHDYLDNGRLLDFLAGNSMNVFLYEDKRGRGLSSAVDNALAVRKPIAVSDSPMFRHILVARPSVCADDSSLRAIYANGFAPLAKLTKYWDAGHLVWEYERILNALVTGRVNRKKQAGLIRKIKSFRNRILSLPDHSFTWLRSTDNATGDDTTPIAAPTYTPVPLGPSNTLNRILDQSARVLYKPAIDHLFRLAPKTMAKKIAEANVQQGFVYDTVMRYMPQFQQSKVLCVGSYEDTAAIALTKMGYEIEEIDPMINYYLQEFYSRPSTKKNSYDIIFSTSVIEHDPDDESFVKCIAELLSENGVAIITCDYKDGWRPSEPKPDVDARFYTKQDLERRLLEHMPGCILVDPPQWDCPNPDFTYLGKYVYTFASFVVRKKTSS